MKSLKILLAIILFLSAYKLALQEPVSVEDREAEVQANLENYQDILSDVGDIMSKHEKKSSKSSKISKLQGQIDKTPKDPLLYLELGAQYYQQGFYDKASEAWNRALELGSKEEEITSIRQYLDDYIGVPQ